MVKIEKNKPLPQHTRFNYGECYAKVVLEKFFPEKYQDLQISDKPDLRTKDENIGIEVTSAIPQNEQEAQALYCKIPYDDEEGKKKKIDRLNKLDYKYTRYGIVPLLRVCEWRGFGYPNIEETFCKDFILMVEKKLNKLNSGNYVLFPENNLFVECELYIEEWQYQKLMDKLCQMSTQQYNYKFIYLLAYNVMLAFDVSAQKYSVEKTENKLEELRHMARTMVEKGEEI